MGKVFNSLSHCLIFQVVAGYKIEYYILDPMQKELNHYDSDESLHFEISQDCYFTVVSVIVSNYFEEYILKH